MSNRVQIEELEQLLQSLEPEEIAAQYGARLDAEAAAHFEAYLGMCRDLDTLSDNLTTLAPPVPEVKRMAVVVPFYRRGVSMPAWSVPLAAAAMLCLGLLLPHLTSTKDEQLMAKALVTTREFPSEMPELDSRIADAFLGRAQALQERREFGKAWDDYNQVLVFLPMSAVGQKDLVLSDMRIIAEEQGDQAKLNALDILANP